MKITFNPARLLGSISKETAVKFEVTLAVNIAMTMRPNRIQMMENIRAMIDFGDLSPYLKQKYGNLDERLVKVQS